MSHIDQARHDDRTRTDTSGATGADAPLPNPATPETEARSGEEKGKAGAKRPERPLPLRLARGFGLFFLGVLFLVAAGLGGGLAFLATDTGRRVVQDALNSALAPTVVVDRLGGSLPLAPVADLRVADGRGVWLTLQGATFTPDFADFPRALGLTVQLDRGTLDRLPETEPAPTGPSEPLRIDAILGTVADLGSLLPDFVPGLTLRDVRVKDFYVAGDILRPTASAAAPADASARQTPAAAADGGAGASSAAQTPAPLPTGGEAKDGAPGGTPATGTTSAPAKDVAGNDDAGRAADLSLRCRLHLTGAVLPDRERAWLDPSTDLALTLAVLPERTARNTPPDPSAPSAPVRVAEGQNGEKSPSANASGKSSDADPAQAPESGPGPDARTVPAKASPQGEEKASSDLPLLPVLDGLAVDMASADLRLTGSLRSPRLAVEVRAGALSAAGQFFEHPVLRVALPENTLSALLDGREGILRLRALALLDASQRDRTVHTLPAAVEAEVGVTLRDGIPLVRLDPRVRTPGLTLGGTLSALLPGRWFGGSAPAAATAAQTPAGGTTGTMPRTTAGVDAGENLEHDVPVEARAPEALAAEDALRRTLSTDVAALLPKVDGSLNLICRDTPLLPLFVPDLRLGGSLSATLGFGTMAHSALKAGDTAATGAVQSLSLEVAGTALALKSGGDTSVSLAALSLSTGMDLSVLASSPAKLLLRAEGLRVPGLDPMKIVLDLQGTPETARLALSSAGGVQSSLRARLEDLARVVALESLDVRIPAHGCGLRTTGPARLTLGPDRTVKNLRLALFPQGEIELQGRFGVSGLDATGKLHLETAPWSRLVPAIPPGTVRAFMRLQGTLSQPRGETWIALDDFVLPADGLPPLSARIESKVVTSGSQARVNTTVRLAEKSNEALGLERFVCETDLPLQASGSGLALRPDAPLKGHLDIRGSASRLWLLARRANTRLAGDFSMEGTITGTMARPDVKANVSVTNGVFSEMALGFQLRDITNRTTLHFPGRFRDTVLEFDIRAKDGRRRPGSLSITGSMHGLDVRGRAVMEKFAPLRRRDIRAVLSADCTISGKVTQPHVAGDFRVVRGRVRLDALEIPASVATLPLTEGPKERVLATRAERRRQAAEAAQKEIPVPATLDLRLGMEKFFVTGYGFDSEWRADMGLSGNAAKPSVSGQVEAVRGSLNLLNKDFTLSEGTVKFAGGLEPMLNIEMTSNISDIETALVISGTPNHLGFNLRSNPALPRNDILAYMLFGKPANELSQFEMLRLGATAASFAAFGSTGGGLTNVARQVTGLDVLNVSQSASGSAQLEMGRYVMDNVYLGVEQETDDDSDTSAVIRIELGPRTTATVKSGSGNTSAGLRWKLDY